MEIHRKKVLLKIMYFAIFIAVVHFISLKFYLYWTTPIDILMHIMGGALVSAIGLWAIYFFNKKSFLLGGSKRIFLLSVTIAFVIGILWEIFELRFGLISHDFIDRIDSIKDILNDIIGALITGSYFIGLIRSNFLSTKT